MSEKQRLRHSRQGSMLTELVVAGGLLVTAMGLVATTVTAGRKLQRVERERIVAVDELSNQLELLMSVPRQQLAAAIAELQPSPWAVQTLAEAALSAKLVDDAYGPRIEMQLNWKRLGNRHLGDAAPLIAVGWLPEPAYRSSSTGESNDAL